ncbi:transcription antitermination factor NusB [Peloplasma aerotolerans]|jgi:transcription antitermination protein NusB|uniref:Transcription antitermination protein NusB n=1 Tax=Peloplasma aerotolerans TaxID=3044389 RepID=A0AAW6UC24_9MOLU|nr:transcription antitermination factor NusB [Mariniplasma sp. M4Ah]MDI6452503.1 transcription antitermination factor NusB [Mariniplasma sp. M4Ah]
MKVTRRELRIELMNALYQYDLYQSEKLLFIPSFEIEEALGIFHEIMDAIKEIDETIESNLYDYSLYRLAYVDRAIIRLAVFELLKTDLPKQIVIDEAVEITKIYSNLDDEKQHKFTNKVIDNIAKKIKG